MFCCCVPATLVDVAVVVAELVGGYADKLLVLFVALLPRSELDENEDAEEDSFTQLLAGGNSPDEDAIAAAATAATVLEVSLSAQQQFTHARSCLPFTSTFPDVQSEQNTPPHTRQ